jgi:hypothetical protein
VRGGQLVETQELGLKCAGEDEPVDRLPSSRRGRAHFLENPPWSSVVTQRYRLSMLMRRVALLVSRLRSAASAARLAGDPKKMATGAEQAWFGFCASDDLEQ